MTTFLLLAIFIASSLSLISYVYCWRDIRRGHPHIISLRQITNIMDRAQLNQLFGPPQPGYYYRLSPEALQGLVRSREGFFYRECAADIVCLLGAWRYMTNGGDETAVGWFILLAGLCQGINFAYSMWLVRKWAHQIREEIDNPRD